MSSEYGVFSDESKHTKGRFRSIGAISLPANYVIEVNRQLSELLAGSDVSEFKWTELRSARHRFCAQKLVDFLIDRLLPKGARIDVLTWDTHDSRHCIYGRDDIRNFERMFFHLHKNLMARRESGAKWHLRPDERVDIDWTTIEDCLGSVGKWRRLFDLPLLSESFSECFFNVSTLKQVASKNTPLSQMADLFAGMVPYTRERSTLMTQLQAEQTGQQSFFEQDLPQTSSNADRDRFLVINHLHARCSNLGLGVSFTTEGYLKTWNPKQPINFWHYVSQYADDKAPTKDD